MPKLIKESEQKRQKSRNLITFSGALIGIDIVLLQAFISIGIADSSLLVAMICFIMAIPSLSANIVSLILIEKEGYVYGNGRTGLICDILFILGTLFTLAGISASIWHLNRILSWVFVGCIIVAYFASAAAVPAESDIANQQKADEKEQKQEELAKEQ